MRGLRLLLVWLLLLALAGWAVWRLTQPERSAPEGLTLQLPRATDVATVEIRPAKGQPVRLRRQHGGWQVRVKDRWVAAHGDLADRLVRDLTHMRISRVVARDDSHDAALGLDKGERVRLADAAGKTLLDVTVGRQGEDLLSTYARIRGRPEALAVDRTLVWQVRRPLNDWVDESKAKAAKAAGQNPRAQKSKAQKPAGKTPAGKARKQAATPAKAAAKAGKP